MERARPLVYLDNAATSFPKPEGVVLAMERFLRTAAGNPGRAGHALAVETERAIRDTRRRLARWIGAPRPERVLFTKNGTEALNLALKGLLRPGDHVVTTAMEHNSVARPLRALEARGVEVTRVPCPGGELRPAELLAALRDGPSGRTRLVAMLHASNVTGAVLPVEEIAAACRRRGILLLLDAAQTAGALPLDVAALGADLVAMPGHKALLGPPGTGALYVAEHIRLAPLLEGGTGSRSESDLQPEELPDAFEAGTPNTVGLVGLGAALEWLEAKGLEAIRRHEAALLARLWEGLAGLPGVALFGPPPGQASSGERAALLSFTLDGWDPADVAAVLDQQFGICCRAGLHCAPGAHRSLGTFPAGTVRFSPGVFTTEAEIDAAIEAVRALATA